MTEATKRDLAHAPFDFIDCDAALGALARRLKLLNLDGVPGTARAAASVERLRNRLSRVAGKLSEDLWAFEEGEGACLELCPNEDARPFDADPPDYYVDLPF